VDVAVLRDQIDHAMLLTDLQQNKNPIEWTKSIINI
jgi:hypothetical protein